MNEFTSPRLALPLLQSGQAQKEMSHNEALARLDMACQAAVSDVGLDTPPVAPATGACWIVGSAPDGAWAGHADALACWTGGGWRFLEAREGLSAWAGESRGYAVFRDGAWHLGEVHGRLLVDGEQLVGARLAAIADPAGGATVDDEARAAIAQVLAAMREHGLIEVV